MPGNCVICGASKMKDPTISLYRIPKPIEVRTRWLRELNLAEEDVTPDSRVCSKHFRDGYRENVPSISIGEKFGLRPSLDTSRGKRQVNRMAKRKQLEESTNSTKEIVAAQVTPEPPDRSICGSVSSSEDLMFSPGTSNSTFTSPRSPTSCTSIPLANPNVQVTVNAALASQVEILQVENKRLKVQLQEAKQAPFSIQSISNDASLVCLYTGFPSYEVFLSFFKFLGPAVHCLHYWGTKRTERKRRMKLDPLNQLFMTLVKLKLDLNIRDIANRFQISTATVSRYFITWVCFLHHELKEVAWFPSKEQVAETLPHAFREKYPTTFAIIDASEVFVETPSDLMLQSTTWSNYKHHNTFKFLVACTPNGAICYISPLYLGSVSDPTLTKDCGFLQKLQGMSGISIMADQGFTVKEALSELGIGLNLPPFMDGHGQLPANEVQQGRSIASLRIHVERAIGRMKLFKIITGVFTLKMSRIANQIISVCAYLTNFHPALVPNATFPASLLEETPADDIDSDVDTGSEVSSIA